ncbi:GNAT family N-acetyltransferase [Modestobacter sp. NPDC049651]|uniref:GNAT family N-acetyltransferase n=1 Tax=unclassified Modestobacter TaxID=2643866 RepID=UPI003411F147
MTLPDLPSGLTARPLEPGDLPAVAALLAAAEEVDDTGEHEDADDLAEALLNDLVDLARDTRVVLDGDRVVAYGDVVAPPTFRGAFGVQLGGRVHPGRRGRGIGRALLGWQLARAAEVHAERHSGMPARVSTSLSTAMTSAEALARRAGLAPQRWFSAMERPLSDLPARREVPGVQLVPFTWDRDDEVRRAHNASFTEHYGSSERDETSWRTWFTGRRAFRPDLSVLAVEDGAVVGYVLAYVHDSDTRATGVATTYLGQIGVLPAARGRGLATASIAAALQVAAEHGCGGAALGVDSENSSGALRLYEGLGFRTRRTHVTWVRELDPVG